MKLRATRSIRSLVQRATSFAAAYVVGRSSLFRNWGLIHEANSGNWQRNITIDPMADLTAFGAVFACVSRIANDIAKLLPGVNVWDAKDRIWVSAPPTTPFLIPLTRPNRYQNRIQFFTAWLISKLLYGNTYVLKERDERGMVRAMYVLDPRKVFPLVTEDGAVYYQLGGDQLNSLTEATVTVPASEIIHDRGVTLWHPLVGVSPLYACAISATQGRLIQENSQRFFRNMSRPSGMLTAPGTISPENAARMKLEWQANYSGENVGKVAVMTDGLKYEPLSIPPETAQLIEQLAWTIEDVARAFLIPLYKINAGAMPTSNNVEALESQYYSGCLQINIESLELCLTEGLAMPAGYTMQFDLDGLLRMDSLTQIDMLAKAVQGTIMAANEARRKLNLPPQEGGDSVLSQQQNYSLAALAKRDAQPDPFATAKPTSPALPAPVASRETRSADEVAADAAADLTRALIERLRSAESLL